MKVFLPNLFSQFGVDPMAVVLGILVFGVIAAVVLGFRYLLESRVDVVEERVRRYVADARPSFPTSSYPPPPLEEAKRSRGGLLLESALKPFAIVARPTDEEDLGHLQSSLSYAGYRSERSMLVYLGVKVLLGLACAGGVIWINSERPQPLQYAAVYTIFAMTVGFYLPSLWLQRVIEARQTRINRALPDTLDLLVTCVDSGLGLDAAMNRVAEEIYLSAPLLSQEIMQAALEIRAGSSRGDAFRRLAARTGVEDIRNLSSIIVQTEIFGTSVAKALRIMADGMRVRRMQKAEERAAAVGVKMTIPLVVFILPALFVVILGPAVVQVVRLLLPTLGLGVR
jgi:tight adherence protein C